LEQNFIFFLCGVRCGIQVVVVGVKECCKSETELFFRFAGILFRIIVVCFSSTFYIVEENAKVKIVLLFAL
jgi:hypothetical protein